MSTEEIYITIIGGGVIGCAIAYEISKDYKQNIVIIEKNSQIKGENQSSRNSGVIHAGIYYPKDMEPLKARMCVEGNDLIYEFCNKYNIPHKRTGKLVVAANQLEEEYLEDTYRIATENKVPGVKIIDSKEVKKLEPNVKALSALYVPTSGIIDSTSLTDRLYRIAESSGAMFLVGNKVVQIESFGDGFQVTIKSNNGTEVFRTKILINSAGLYSDEVAKMLNTGSHYEMNPIKGESAKFYHTKREEISINGHNIYPVPFGYLPDGQRFNVHFKEFQKLYREGKINKSVGAHLTPTLGNVPPPRSNTDILSSTESNYFIGDTVTVGPAYSKPDGKEDYRPTRDEKYFLNIISPLFPYLKLEDISLHQTGIRAKLKDHSDFVIERDPKYQNCINLIGMDSPGLTSSLAIAKYVKQLLE
ncbi:MAG: NAD(P)/FAD-dependent oxidoreductase [Actinobacteria bacterium]|nr:NAD(P)/FAD-dependent oxidoreductase [Actinomycetota bacterium]